MQALKPVQQHRPIVLVQNLSPNLDDVVGPDADKLPVEGGVVQLAEREPVLNARLTAGLCVWNDVGGVEQLLVAEPA